MGASLIYQHSTLILIVGLLLLALISLSVVAFRANSETKRLRKKLSHPDSLPITLRNTDQLLAKIEGGQSTFLQVKRENSRVADKIRHINVKLYPPVYRHDDSDDLKQAVSECREKQLTCILKGQAVDSLSNWEWFGSQADGRAMVAAYKELLISAFNAEFDTIRRQMRATTISTARGKLARLRDQLEKLSETVKCTITIDYFHLKLNELEIWGDELLKREEEKAQKKLNQQKLREQNKVLGAEIDTEEIEDQIEFSQRDLARAKAKAQKLAGLAGKEMDDEIASLEKQIAASEEKLKKSMPQAQLTRAGFIYVVSNIGSFGEGIVKIGMTRRLEPMDRVVELGDASVPFRFDVHTLAFVEDAPTIERKLHDKFDDRRVNTKNTRKEFFRVTPQEVRSALEGLNVKSDWYFEVEAREYRETQAISAAKKPQTTGSAKFPEAI